MTDIDLSVFRKLFFETAKSYVFSLDNSFKKILLSNNDFEAINQAFISSHSLKSQSHVMGYSHFANLSGVLEHVFRALKEGKLQYTAPVGESLGNAVTALRSSLELLEKSGEDKDNSSIVSQVIDVTGIGYPDYLNQ